MGSNFKMWWKSGGARMPLVRRDIKRFSSADNPFSDGLSLLSDRHAGRLAKSDQVASCLLRREYADALPLRREALVERNRRRLKLLFILMLTWWFAGWLFIN